MTNDEAQALGKRIINTFRLTPPLTEWVDTLASRDHATALGTFIRLREDIDGALSIARFVHEYRANLNTRERHSDQTPMSDDEAISFTDYIARVTVRANDGNQQASDELEKWRQFKNVGT